MSVYELFVSFLRMTWRRRALLLLPFLFLAPVSIVAAKYAPLTYTARTLLLLRETARPNVLSKDTTPAKSPEDIAAGLRALLFSEHILSQALQKEGMDSGDEPIHSQRLEELRKKLNLSNPGGNFLELTLSGSNPEDLGRELQAILAVLLQELVWGDSNESALDYIAAERAKEIKDSQAELSEIKQNLGTAKPTDAGSAVQYGASAVTECAPTLNIRINSLESRLDSLAKDISDQKAASSSPRPLGILNAPDQIEIIDRPTIPRVPKIPRLYYALGGVIASLLLGIALVVLAEVKIERT